MRTNDIFTTTYSPGSDPLRSYRSNGQEGVRSDDMGPPKHPAPIDKFDDCCLAHDICLARVDELFPAGTNGRDEEIKTCDAKISACWFTAQFKEKKVCIAGRIKALFGAAVMAPFAHPFSSVPMIDNEGRGGIGLIVIKF